MSSNSHFRNRPRHPKQRDCNVCTMNESVNMFNGYNQPLYDSDPGREVPVKKPSPWSYGHNFYNTPEHQQPSHPQAAAWQPKPAYPNVPSKCSCRQCQGAWYPKEQEPVQHNAPSQDMMMMGPGPSAAPVQNDYSVEGYPRSEGYMRPTSQIPKPYQSCSYPPASNQPYIPQRVPPLKQTLPPPTEFTGFDRNSEQYMRMLESSGYANRQVEQRAKYWDGSNGTYYPSQQYQYPSQCRYTPYNTPYPYYQGSSTPQSYQNPQAQNGMQQYYGMTPNPMRQMEGRPQMPHSFLKQELAANKMSPLRMMRKKKMAESVCQQSPPRQSQPSNSSAPALDVRRFLSTWADGEDEEPAQQEMVVLDCQEINPEQAELLQMYEESPFRFIHDPAAGHPTVLQPCDPAQPNSVEEITQSEILDLAPAPQLQQSVSKDTVITSVRSQIVEEPIVTTSENQLISEAVDEPASAGVSTASPAEAHTPASPATPTSQNAVPLPDLPTSEYRKNKFLDYDIPSLPTATAEATSTETPVPFRSATQVSCISTQPVSYRPTTPPFYHRPATTTPVSCRPTTTPVYHNSTTTPVYHRPTTPPVYHQAPTTPPVYHKTTTTLAYHRPTTPPVYHKTTTTPVYHRPTTPPVVCKEATPPVSLRPASPVSCRPTTPTVSCRPTTPPVSCRPTTQPVSSRPTTQPVSCRPATPPVSCRPATPPVSSVLVTPTVSSKPVTPPTTVPNDVSILQKGKKNCRKRTRKPTIKFSIQKSHDLKISLRVMNEGKSPTGGEDEKVAAGNQKENADSSETFTLRVEGAGAGDGEEEQPDQRSKRLRKVKKRRTAEQAYSVCSEDQNDATADGFQVQESMDSAKIKLTFKRRRGYNDAGSEGWTREGKIRKKKRSKKDRNDGEFDGAESSEGEATPAADTTTDCDGRPSQSPGDAAAAAVAADSLRFNMPVPVSHPTAQLPSAFKNEPDSSFEKQQDIRLEQTSNTSSPKITSSCHITSPRTSTDSIERELQAIWNGETREASKSERRANIDVASDSEAVDLCVSENHLDTADNLPYQKDLELDQETPLDLRGVTKASSPPYLGHAFAGPELPVSIDKILDCTVDVRRVDEEEKESAADESLNNLKLNSCAELVEEPESEAERNNEAVVSPVQLQDQDSENLLLEKTAENELPVASGSLSLWEAESAVVCETEAVVINQETSQEIQPQEIYASAKCEQTSETTTKPTELHVSEIEQADEDLPPLIENFEIAKLKLCSPLSENVEYENLEPAVAQPNDQLEQSLEEPCNISPAKENTDEEKAESHPIENDCIDENKQSDPIPAEVVPDTKSLNSIAENEEAKPVSPDVVEPVESIRESPVHDSASVVDMPSLDLLSPEKPVHEPVDSESDDDGALHKSLDRIFEVQPPLTPICSVEPVEYSQDELLEEKPSSPEAGEAQHFALSSPDKRSENAKELMAYDSSSPYSPSPNKYSEYTGENSKETLTKLESVQIGPHTPDRTPPESSSDTSNKLESVHRGPHTPDGAPSESSNDTPTKLESARIGPHTPDRTPPEDSNDTPTMVERGPHTPVLSESSNDTPTKLESARIGPHTPDGAPSESSDDASTKPESVFIGPQTPDRAPSENVIVTPTTPQKSVWRGPHTPDGAHSESSGDTPTKLESVLIGPQTPKRAPPENSNVTPTRREAVRRGPHTPDGAPSDSPYATPTNRESLRIRPQTPERAPPENFNVTPTRRDAVRRGPQTPDGAPLEEEESPLGKDTLYSSDAERTPPRKIIGPRTPPEEPPPSNASSYWSSYDDDAAEKTSINSESRYRSHSDLFSSPRTGEFQTTELSLDADEKNGFVPTQLEKDISVQIEKSLEAVNRSSSESHLNETEADPQYPLKAGGEEDNQDDEELPVLDDEIEDKDPCALTDSGIVSSPPGDCKEFEEAESLILPTSIVNCISPMSSPAGPRRRESEKIGEDAVDEEIEAVVGQISDENDNIVIAVDQVAELVEEDALVVETDSLQEQEVAQDGEDLEDGEIVDEEEYFVVGDDVVFEEETLVIELSDESGDECISAPVFEIDVSDIPLPPGEPPKTSVFDLAKFKEEKREKLDRELVDDVIAEAVIDRCESPFITETYELFRNPSPPGTPRLLSPTLPPPPSIELSAIPPSELCADGDAVPDEDEFHDVMENCLANAKKFLTREKEEEEISKSEETISSKDVLLSAYEVASDLEIGAGVSSSEVSVDFSTFYTSLGPESLPVDNWPYLEEEVPLSPTWPKDEEDIPLEESEETEAEEPSTTVEPVAQPPATSCPLPNPIPSLKEPAQPLGVNVPQTTKTRRKTFDPFPRPFTVRKAFASERQPAESEVETDQMKENTSENLKCRLSLDRLEAEEDLRDKKCWWPRNICKGKSDVKCTGQKEDEYKDSKWQPKVILSRVLTRNSRSKETTRKSENTLKTSTSNKLTNKAKQATKKDEVKNKAEPAASDSVPNAEASSLTESCKDSSTSDGFSGKSKPESESLTNKETPPQPIPVKRPSFAEKIQEVEKDILRKCSKSATSVSKRRSLTKQQKEENSPPKQDLGSTKSCASEFITSLKDNYIENRVEAKKTRADSHSECETSEKTSRSKIRTVSSSSVGSVDLDVIPPEKEVSSKKECSKRVECSSKSSGRKKSQSGPNDSDSSPKKQETLRRKREPEAAVVETRESIPKKGPSSEDAGAAVQRRETDPKNIQDETPEAAIVESKKSRHKKRSIETPEAEVVVAMESKNRSSGIPEAAAAKTQTTIPKKRPSSECKTAVVESKESVTKKSSSVIPEVAAVKTKGTIPKKGPSSEPPAAECKGSSYKKRSSETSEAAAAEKSKDSSYKKRPIETPGAASLDSKGSIPKQRPSRTPEATTVVESKATIPKKRLSSDVAAAVESKDSSIKKKPSETSEPAVVVESKASTPKQRSSEIPESSALVESKETILKKRRSSEAVESSPKKRPSESHTRSHSSETRKSFVEERSEIQERDPSTSSNGSDDKRSRPARRASRSSTLRESSKNDKMKKESSTGRRDPEERASEAWVCGVCGFNDASQQQKHVQEHSFHCQSCHLAFKTEEHFIGHLTKRHEDIRKMHHCLLCEQSFDTEVSYQDHIVTRSHRHIESVEKNTIHTLFTLLLGQPCPVLGPVEPKSEWLPNQAGTVHFYHQATPLSLAVQYWKMKQSSAVSKP